MNYYIICVSMKIDKMVNFDRFGVPKPFGPMFGSTFAFWGTKSGQEPNQSDCDTFFVYFDSGQKTLSQEV